MGRHVVAKFIFYRDSVGQFRWRFRADNGQIVADSTEGHESKKDALNGIAIVMREAPSAMIDDQTKNWSDM